MPNIHTYTIGGYTPEYDAKQLEAFSVVDGKNFMPTVEGYKSEFGSDVLTDNRINPKYLYNAEIFSLAEQKLILCNNFGIMSWDSTSESWYFLVRSSVELQANWPWSVAYVGGDWYFCKFGFGVWRLRLEVNSGTFLSANLPDSPCSVCASDGRLVILGSSSYAWSAVGDGTDLTTSLATGAGFQTLAICGGGKPLVVKPNTQGFLVYTTTGIIKAESIDTPNPYYHKLLAGIDYAPISPNAVTEIGTGSHIFLAKSGLYATSGGYPENFEKEFSEYIVGNKLKYLIKTSQRAVPIKLGYDANNRWLLINYADFSIESSPYTTCYVCDLELAKWGRYDQAHYFIGNAYIPSGKYEGYQLITGTQDGAIRLLDKDYGISELASEFYKNNYPVVEVPSYVESTTAVFTSSAKLETYNWLSLGNYGETLGFFEYNVIASSQEPDLSLPTSWLASRGNVVVYDMLASSLKPNRVVYNLNVFWTDMLVNNAGHIDMLDGDYTNIFTTVATMDAGFSQLAEYQISGKLSLLPSQLDLGLYHIADFDSMQCSSILTGFCQIHDETQGADSIIDMQNLGESTVDMETFDNQIDMGMGFLSNPDFQTTLISSSDGYGHLDYHTDVIDVLNIVGNRFNYNCYSTGLYHGFRLATQKAGDYYHLKQIQVDIIQGGMIYA